MGWLRRLLVWRQVRIRVRPLLPKAKEIKELRLKIIRTWWDILIRT
jgi:hypothetical protein